MSTDATEFNYITGFNKARAMQILLANFGGKYCNAKIGLLTQLPEKGDQDDSDGTSSTDKQMIEVSSMSDVLNEETGQIERKPNGYKRIDMKTVISQDGYIQNTEELHFPEATQPWGDIVGFVISSNFQGLDGEYEDDKGEKKNRYYTDNGDCFIGALPEATTLQVEGDGRQHYGKFVDKDTIALFRAGYIRIGLDHKPPAIEI